ncbi:diacylglycerol kinase, putative [Entamoeba invadens IP1]|uniref:Diacylglycerol kinase n=1 Tax=Entamoeba invadens IP1 TaxID=370355 RepID=A0A0A1UEY7_ENTIV|nr:diacylglycerol kinase, putative [Entamoeba invadens IP1]ELP91366.1 diacylglycerol kinase, putative [Entamoeba invadens IP1]|eukprot:XP_004258137.1 diacylglycerol kinase, putative [Entamoeba invadens IP1]
MSINISESQLGVRVDDLKNSCLFQSQHDFKDDFVVSSQCTSCGQLIVGPSAKCTKCSCVFHKSCCQHVFTPCIPKEADGHLQIPAPTFHKKDLKNGQHSFYKKSGALGHFCPVCFELLIKRYQCAICGMNVHKKCIKKLAIPCRPIFTLKGSHDTHWFVQNIKNRGNGLCVVCGDTSSAAHYVCAWCGLCVDPKCIDKVPNVCFRGRLGKFVVPPRLVEPSGDWYKATNDKSVEPMIFFINKKSGGHFGSDIFRQAIGIFNPTQVYNVFWGYKKPFEYIKDYGNDFIAVICGGDGTVGWVMDELKKAGLRPKIYVIPLGTGNDMSISTGWGGGYDGQDIYDLLPQVSDASVHEIDRWKVVVGDATEPLHVFNNYYSIGIDALIALTFHTKRNANPEKFKSPLANKIQYVMCSTEHLLPPEVKLYTTLHLKVDGRDVELPKIEGLALINLPTYGGGNKFWPSVSLAEMAYGFHDLHIGDGEIEVVGFSSIIHLGACVSGTGASKPIRIAQGKEIEIQLDEDVPCQYDGEPYLQTKGVLKITLHEKVRFVVKNSFPVNSY